MQLGVGKASNSPREGDRGASMAIISLEDSINVLATIGKRGGKKASKPAPR